MTPQTDVQEIDMEFADIAGTPLKVSRVAIGTWAIGGWMWGGTDEAQSISTIRAALDHGINVVDTAPAYGFGRSEEIVGRAIAEGRLRGKVIIASKVGLEWRDGKVFRNASRARIFREIEDSLRRLQIEREVEADLLRYCRKNNIATFGYGALCRGLLSGRMRKDTAFDGDDLRRTDPKFRGARFGQYLAAVQRLDELARRRFGKRVIQLAVRWMLDQGITTALWGARRPEQLQPVDEVRGWSLDAEAKAQIEQILAEEVKNPVGPEFMAPPARA